FQQTEAHDVSLGSQADEPRAESTVGKSERSRAETKAHHVGISPPENCGSTKGTVGEDTGGKEGIGGLSSLRKLNSWRSHPVRLKEALPRCEVVLHQIKALKACAMVYLDLNAFFSHSISAFTIPDSTP